jgi:hypothetical protein
MDVRDLVKALLEENLDLNVAVEINGRYDFEIKDVYVDGRNMVCLRITLDSNDLRKLD